ncbi:hypothetical protein B0J15DRAFT_257718 [Fusarium solani]|uniref:Uncharacterized protein n=1 Tax=Fusarium solani TaxID=169388 RepID=A0A9P9HV28_FUSSL|nr:uncharacterized protein B0J15DRAFT_257718 [Fusarium solani]KAH7263911.1 hypothetical protein B0J15DRAFT_257718 [Fusarium solani]
MAHAPVLSDLPFELLHLIFGHFCLHCRGGFREPYWVEKDAGHGRSEAYLRDRHTLFSLCLVSRRMRDAAQHVLHHEFILGYAHLQTRWTYSWRGRLTSFIRTVSTRRDLAALVKTVFFYPSLQEGVELGDAWLAMRHAADALQVDLAEVWKRRDLDDRERSWRMSRVDYELRRELFLGPLHSIDRVTRPGDLDALVPELFAVLLALLPNLKHLAFGTDPGTSSIGVGVLYWSPAAISALGVIKLPLRILETPFRPGDLSKLTPDLESLTCDRIGGLEEFSFPRLTSLCIRDIRVGKYAFGEIAEFCPEGLSSFTYETGGSWEVGGGSILQPSDVVAQLSKFRGTLGSLHLDFRSKLILPRDIRMDFPCLEGFIVLQSLFLTTNVIYHDNNLELPDEDSLVDILPPSIVSLTLAKTAWPTPPQRLMRGLLGLAKYKRRNPERFRKLKFVRFDTKQVCSDSSVKEAFGEAGIDLVYGEFPRKDWSYNDIYDH